MTAPRPPIIRTCTICGTHRATYFTVYDRELHLCRDCWRWDVASVLDTLNIPETEEEDAHPSDVR